MHYLTKWFIPLLSIQFIAACSGNDNNEDDRLSSTPTSSTQTRPQPDPVFPDSTNLKNAADSLYFAEHCIFDFDRNDIADRYFRGIVRGFDPEDSCNQTICTAYSWLGWEESRRQN